MGEISAYLRYWASKNKLNLVVIRTNSFGTYNTQLSLNHCDAFICVLNAVSPSLLQHIPSHKPFVAIGCNDYNDYGVESVFSDHKQGIAQVVDHLHKLGHRKIGYMADFGIVDMVIRHEGYTASLAKYDLPYDEKYVFRADEPSMEGGRSAFSAYLQSRPDITALIASADLMAIGFIQAMSSENLSCPKDLAITGYEATTLGRHFSPSLTSVNQHMCEVVKTAIERVKLRLAGHDNEPNPILIPQALYIGTSCGSSASNIMDDRTFIEKRSSGIPEFQSKGASGSANESLTAFAKAGFESLISTSYLFGPFMSDGYRARWQGEGDQLSLRLYSHFTYAGHQTLTGKTKFLAPDYPPAAFIDKDTPYICNVMPISAGETDWEVIAIFDECYPRKDFNSLALFNNYLDMIIFALERDAYSLLSNRREEESRVLANRVLELNSSLEDRVLERTEQLNALNSSLTDKNSELERVSQYKSEFISNMSHELRTPLNSILGFSNQLLRKSEQFDEKVVASIQAIHRNSQHLNELINDVLEISNIESGFLLLNHSSVNLVEIIESTIDLQRRKAEAKNLEIIFKTPTAGNSIQVSADGERIKQVAFNLLSNAIKFTDKGTISIEVGLTRHPKVEMCCYFSITDTGMGIEHELLATLFNKFERSEKLNNSNIQGTGLGLVIVKEIVEMHKGYIDVNSTVGKGSKFTVYLPN